eukprot:UN4111
MLVVVKLPYLKSTMLCSKLSKGMGHNYYGEPAWPNDILYIFPVVIFGVTSLICGLAVLEPLSIGTRANPFATPLEILPEWYFFPHSIYCVSYLINLSVLWGSFILLVFY